MAGENAQRARFTITGEDLECFNKMITMLDDIEDVREVYHNVNL